MNKMPKFVIQAIEELKRVDGKSSPFLFMCKDQWERALERWHYFQEQGIVEQWNSKELAGSARRDFQSYCRLAGINTHKNLISIPSERDMVPIWRNDISH
ncbi:MAG: hypothetical protein ABFD91_13710 [Anaerohalosphaeraceae bacterium]